MFLVCFWNKTGTSCSLAHNDNENWLMYLKEKSVSPPPPSLKSAVLNLKNNSFGGPAHVCVRDGPPGCTVRGQGHLNKVQTI